jgi:lysophospholipase L1-like esterase
VTFGVYLEDHETYPAQLESLLNRRQLHGKTWQIFNLGVIGYNTINEVEWLKEKGLRYKPDLVILQYCVNDHSNRSTLDVRLKKHNRHNSHLVPILLNPVSRILSHSRLFVFCAVNLRDILQKHSQQTSNQSADGKQGGHIVERGFREFKRLSVQHDFQTLVLISPAFEGKERFSDYSRNYERIVNMCRNYDLPFLNLLDILKREHDYAANTISLDADHLSAYGCRYVAECIVNKVLVMNESGR